MSKQSNDTLVFSTVKLEKKQYGNNVTRQAKLAFPKFRMGNSREHNPIGKIMAHNWPGFV
jgi:hypothetical protein